MNTTTYTINDLLDRYIKQYNPQDDITNYQAYHIVLRLDHLYRAYNSEEAFNVRFNYYLYYDNVFQSEPMRTSMDDLIEGILTRLVDWKYHKLKPKEAEFFNVIYRAIQQGDSMDLDG